MLTRPVLTYIATHALKVNVHAHCCYQIIVSLDTPFACSFKGETINGIYGFILNRSVSQACTSPDSTVVVNLIDPESHYGQQLGKLLGHKSYQLIPAHSSDSGAAILPTGFANLSSESLAIAVNSYLDKIPDLPEIAADETDDRIIAAMVFIDNHLSERIGVNAVAEAVFLSPDRLRHLFGEQAGMPISHYILWKRIKKVLAQSFSGSMTLSLACKKYNFPDQSHFNHMVMKIFGVPPMAVLKIYRIIQ